MPQQCLLPQKPFLFRCHSSAVPTKATFSLQMSQHCPLLQNLLSLFRCHSSARFCRSHFLFSEQQQCPLPQEPVSLFNAHRYFLLPQQYPLPQEPHSLSRHCSSVHLHRSLILSSDAAAVSALAEAHTFKSRCHSSVTSTEATFSLSRCHSSSCFRRSHFLFSDDVLFSDDAPVPAPAEAAFSFQMLQQEPISFLATATITA
ncbi:hypothetical protein ROHU_033066 [Labeo rohita]|uniref:Uncharacterized protein n=1 Tax=Labeo rohita TaxID=84645 RepID=A0A498LKE7_LABRO|nr:hypothetical protein ROHU_033066 [Labeo rohita]